MLPSLHAIARDLGGKVRGDHVVAPGPGQKRGDRSLCVWVNPNGEIGVHSHRGDDWRVGQAHVRERCGLAPWTPTPPKQATWRAPLPERNQYVSETLRIARSRKHITFPQFDLLVNDLKNVGHEARAKRYAREFGFTDAESKAFESQLLLEAGKYREADEMAYQSMLQAARTLVQLQWLDVPTDPDTVVNEFRSRFVEPKIFWDTYHAGQFANYLFARHWDGPDTRYTQDTAHKLVEEANLFIDAAHKAHAKYRSMPGAGINLKAPAPAIPV